MSFVRVRHEDGREADITTAEVEDYGAMGFEPVDKSAVKAAARDDAKAAKSDRLPPPMNGTDQRLDAILDELRAVRDAFTKWRASDEPAQSSEGETVELRGAGEAASDTGVPSFTEPTPTTTTTTTAAPTTTTTTTAAPKR